MTSPSSPPLVILGCGYLGTALARAVLARGGTVSALTRNVERAAELRAQGVPTAQSDLASDAWHAMLNPAGAAVVVCVAPSRPDVEGYRHSFVAGLDSVWRWLRQSVAAGHPPARELFFTSATSVYPQADGGWVDESSPIDVSLLGPAAAILRVAEEKILGVDPALAWRAWVLRLAGIYGPDRNHLLAALRQGQRVFGGTAAQWVNLIHRDDGVGAIQHFIATPASQAGGLYNLVDNHPVQKAALLADLARAEGLHPAEVRCDENLSSGRSGHRRNVTGQIPNRRVSNARLLGAGYKLIYESFAKSLAGGLTTP